MRFVVDGTDYTVLKELLENLIKLEKDEMEITLKNIQKEAVLSIQSAENPRIMYHKMCSYTDIFYSDESEEYDKLWEGE
jgi:flagellar motor component MotA